jgi:hypothetical protein
MPKKFAWLQGTIKLPIATGDSLLDPEESSWFQSKAREELYEALEAIGATFELDTCEIDEE